MTPIEPTGPPGIAMLPTCFNPCARTGPADAIAAAAKRVVVMTRVFDRAGIWVPPIYVIGLLLSASPPRTSPVCIIERLDGPSFVVGDLTRIRFLDLARHEGRQIFEAVVDLGLRNARRCCGLEALRCQCPRRGADVRRRWRIGRDVL